MYIYIYTYIYTITYIYIYIYIYTYIYVSLYIPMLIGSRHHQPPIQGPYHFSQQASVSPRGASWLMRIGIGKIDNPISLILNTPLETMV